MTKPVKPAVDPDIGVLLAATRTLENSQLYHNSYLSRGTINNLRKRKTKRPSHMTMVGIAAAAGLKWKLTKV
jgi:hypothetical protein